MTHICFAQAFAHSRTQQTHHTIFQTQWKLCQTKMLLGEANPLKWSTTTNTIFGWNSSKQVTWRSCEFGCVWLRDFGSQFIIMNEPNVVYSLSATALIAHNAKAIAEIVILIGMLYLPSEVHGTLIISSVSSKHFVILTSNCWNCAVGIYHQSYAMKRGRKTKHKEENTSRICSCRGVGCGRPRGAEEKLQYSLLREIYVALFVHTTCVWRTKRTQET